MLARARVGTFGPHLRRRKCRRTGGKIAISLRMPSRSIRRKEQYYEGQQPMILPQGIAFDVQQNSWAFIIRRPINVICRVSSMSEEAATRNDALRSVIARRQIICNLGPEESPSTYLGMDANQGMRRRAGKHARFFFKEGVIGSFSFV
jgi:hypothetical protein